jgi:hypothetical protein
MGRPDVDIEPPSLVHTPSGPRYRLAWGSDPGTPGSVGWHSATEDGSGEHITAAAWVALTVAAAQGAVTLDAALTASSAGTAWTTAKKRAAQAGQTTLLSATRARYLAWHGAPLTSQWITCGA